MNNKTAKGSKEWTDIIANSATGWDKSGKARFLKNSKGDEDIERPRYILLRNKAKQTKRVALTTSSPDDIFRPAEDETKAISLASGDYKCVSDSGADTACEYRAVGLVRRIWFAKDGRSQLAVALLGCLVAAAGALGEFTTELADRHLPLWWLIIIGALIVIGIAVEFGRKIAPPGN